MCVFVHLFEIRTPIADPVVPILERQGKESHRAFANARRVFKDVDEKLNRSELKKTIIEILSLQCTQEGAA